MLSVDKGKYNDLVQAATADLPTASFAGQQQRFNVAGRQCLGKDQSMGVAFHCPSDILSRDQ